MKEHNNSIRVIVLGMINFIFIILIMLIFSDCTVKNQKTVGLYEKVVISPDHKGFMLAKTHQTFHPWGMNYGHYGMLTEDSQSAMWDTLATDFQKMKDMGINDVRVHVQFDELMITAYRPNEHALAGYKRLLALAQKTGLYLDITGLACYRPAKRLLWYDSLDESDRWKAQARFWGEVAKATAENPAVFCYDLINEPTIPTNPLKKVQEVTLTEAWYSGALGGYDFCQYITLDPKERSIDAIRHQWIRQLTTAIRQYDSKTLITVGLLPWTNAFGSVDSVASDLDFISVHIYPEKNRPNDAMKQLEQCNVGKPVVIEETYPLSSGIDQWLSFMHESRSVATGWVGHYLFSYSLKELNNLKNKTIGEALYQDWLRTFVEMKPQFSSDSVYFIPNN